jgi:hypothetical protein
MTTQRPTEVPDFPQSMSNQARSMEVMEKAAALRSQELCSQEIRIAQLRYR